eukprot:7389054-Prymnesium_polylepis.1
MAGKTPQPVARPQSRRAPKTPAAASMSTYQASPPVRPPAAVAGTRCSNRPGCKAISPPACPLEPCHQKQPALLSAAVLPAQSTSITAETAGPRRPCVARGAASGDETAMWGWVPSCCRPICSRRFGRAGCYRTVAGPDHRACIAMPTGRSMRRE